MQALKEQIKTATTRAYSLKTKKAQTKAWDLVRALKHQLFIQLCDQRDMFATQSVKATVRWFHAGDDHVCIETPYGTLYASPTSDVVSKSWYGHTCCVEYTEGQELVVELEVELSDDHMGLIVIPKRIYGGTLNEPQYAELCKRDDLAFFKYPNSTGITGLFSNKAGA